MVLSNFNILQNENTEKKGKKTLKTVELPIKEVVKSHTPTQLNNLIERESQMVQADKLENDRINAKVRSRPSGFYKDFGVVPRNISLVPAPAKKLDSMDCTIIIFTLHFSAVYLVTVESYER